jgi:eukaryotic-like serine/threonine-protein kinase
VNQTRWNRITELFLSALELPPDGRQAFLESACAGDPDLRSEVEALLGADGSARRQLEKAVAQAHAEFEDADVAEGRTIGPYLLVRELGAGGMGTVYHAIRSDGEFVQAVAVKVIKRGMDSESILRRFRLERQILARLEHANIARLLDGGSTASGQPYFVMEYVDGVSITEFADTHNLTVRERLKLFLPVCDGVQAAHRNLIVHRDLKPGNILINREAVPKLLDFGIAKLLDTDVVPETVPATATGIRLLTPEYASPEQVRGEPVSTATDVYSLGAVLYELLTGRKPHLLTRHSPMEIERAICTVDPSRPSTVAIAISSWASYWRISNLRKAPLRFPKLSRFDVNFTMLPRRISMRVKLVPSLSPDSPARTTNSAVVKKPSYSFAKRSPSKRRHWPATRTESRSATTWRGHAWCSATCWHRRVSGTRLA